MPRLRCPHSTSSDHPCVPDGGLALLGTATRRGVIVTGHVQAINVICSWLDQWQRTTSAQISWPEVISRHDHRTASATHAGPHRPSWCYGTPGIARAQQLAGIATHHHNRITTAEQALKSCITDDNQLRLLTEPGLCHGWAGLVHTVRRAANDARTQPLALAGGSICSDEPRHRSLQPKDIGDGFLTGSAGVTLVDLTDASIPLAWDACLLLV
jgi:lantibiotic biosynthesis protein